jgi:hypothetical protein
MARKKAGQTRAGQNVKLSIVVPKELHDQVEQACSRHSLSRSLLIQKVIAAGIAAWLEPQGTPAGALQQQQGVATTVQVTPELGQALEAVGRYTGLNRDAVAQLVLGENLGTFCARARQRHEELLRLPAPPTRGGDEPEPA